jgi:glycerophosphoryl diester phosphodiesterase
MFLRPLFRLLTALVFVSLPLSAAGFPQLIAHRGSSHTAPENTLAAFRLALEEGADGIEGDFFLSADGEVVALHDRTTKRTAGVDLDVRETAWARLAELDVGAWKHARYRGERIPRLAEILDVLPPDKWFFIEIKDSLRIVEPIRRILAEKKPNPQRVVLISFDADVIRECRKRMPEYQAHWISALKDVNKPGMEEKYFGELEASSGQGLQFNATAPVRREWLRKVKESGYLLTSWTVNEVRLAERMIGHGVDFITTDRPGGLRGELAARSGRWNVRDHIAHEDFMIQAHRGAGELAPENTRETFELAWSLGTIPEADLRTTTDGVIVAFHDNHFARMLPEGSEEMKRKGIQDLSWDEVAALDIGAWKGAEFKGQRVPRLSELFDLLKVDAKRLIYVDIKNVDLKQLAEEAHAAGVAPRLILASTVPKVIRDWKALAPSSKTLHWMGGDEEALAKRLATLEGEGFAGVDQLQIHVRKAGDAFTPSAGFLEDVGEKLRKHGILFQVLPWGVKDPEIYQQLMDLGVASFATDYPDVTAESVKAYYEDR